MRQFSTVELTQKIGTVTHAATREPVAITHHRKPRFVLMSIEDYERMTGRSDPRIVATLDAMPDELLGKLEREYERYRSEGEDG